MPLLLFDPTLLTVTLHCVFPGSPLSVNVSVKVDTWVNVTFWEAGAPLTVRLAEDGLAV